MTLCRLILWAWRDRAATHRHLDVVPMRRPNAMLTGLRRPYRSDALITEAAHLNGDFRRIFQPRHRHICR